MDDNRNNRTEYEPNFILKDSPVEEPTSVDASEYAETSEHTGAPEHVGAPEYVNVSEHAEAPEHAESPYHAEPWANTHEQGPAETQANSYEPGYEPERSDTLTDQPLSGSYRDPRDNFADSGKHHRKRGASRKSNSPVVTFTRRTLIMLLVAVMVISVVFGGTAAVIANSVLGSDHSSSSRTPSDSKNYTLEDATDSSMSIAAITDKTQDSVVEIRTESISSDSWIQEYVTEGAGSGVIITTDGYIVTNNHVIEDASKITVTTTDDKSYSAKVVGADDINDIAVLKISATGLSAATYGNSDQLEVGEMAVAIGNPLGELGGSVTSGIISALDREVSIDGNTMNLLQTDASINPGNSGGGLFNDEGQLIGIVVAKSSGSDIDNIGFAIPINTVADVADQLMSKGYVSNQPSTGMSYTEQSVRGGMMSGDSESSAYVYIAEVTGKNAKAAGFKAGDLVYALDGQVIDSFDSLKSIITSKKVGDKVKYTIVRDNQTKEITLELEEKTN